MADEIKQDSDSSTPPSAPPAGGPPPSTHPSVTAKKLAAKSGEARSEPFTGPLVDAIHQKFSGALIEAHVMLGQNVLMLEKSALMDVMRFLREDDGALFDYLVDVTAVDYPQREERFDVIYVLYSHSKNERLRVKIRIQENEDVPTVTGLWETANWLEREVYDMFGIIFSGHPNLTRILLPDGWKGHPLRKDYHLQQMDNDWVRANLNIESGQDLRQE